MEWVETTGKSIEEAKDLALDQLGVDSAEAEFEILEEPKSGLFGRTRGEARVRARVVPLTPPPKTERRRKTGQRRNGESNQRRSRQDAQQERQSTPSSQDDSPRAGDGGGGDGGTASAAPERSGGGRSKPRQQREKVERELMDASEQVETLEAFLRDLVGAFGLDATVAATLEDNELRANVTGEGLGILVGPRLATLDAVQEVARHALQRQAAGREYAKVVVDVGDIRNRRREALAEFVQEAAQRVKDDDVEVVFEVMSSVDRKQVHDLITTIDGVESASEGEDPRRRVVIRSA